MNSTEFDYAWWQVALAGISPDVLAAAVESVSPIGVVITEQYRRLASEGRGLGAHVPVDRFVFGVGEPKQPYATKVNGAPYRPPNDPWPVDLTGIPLTFFMQFCFSESLDHVGSLPGDVLLVFVRTHESYLLPGVIAPWVLLDEPDSFVFEWYSIGNSIVQRSDVPVAPRFVFPTCFSQRHRSVDYLDEALAAGAMSAVVPPDALPRHEFFRSAALRALCRYPYFKIGGLPFWFDPTRASPDRRFIASFGNIGIVPDCPYPWLNHPATMPIDEAVSDENSCRLWDSCCVNLFLQPDGTVHWELDLLT